MEEGKKHHREDERQKGPFLPTEGLVSLPHPGPALSSALCALGPSAKGQGQPFLRNLHTGFPFFIQFVPTCVQIAGANHFIVITVLSDPI